MSVAANELGIRIPKPPPDSRESASDEPFLDAPIPLIPPSLMQQRLEEISRVHWENNSTRSAVTVFDGSAIPPKEREIRIIGRPAVQTQEAPAPGIRRIATISAKSLAT
jgi:hypothetical protein